MLGNEYRMPSHRSLLPIIFRERWCQSVGNEINGVRSDGVYALVVDVLEVLVSQFESGSEFGFFQGGEGLGDLVGHNLVTISPSGLPAIDSAQDWL